MFFQKKNAYEKSASNLCQTAIEYARSFEKELDFSHESIKDLEEILDYYSKDIEVSQPTDQQVWSMALIFGSYLGETMLKNGLKKKGYRWDILEDNEIMLLLHKDKSYYTPVDKVYKRLVYGQEDSVESFYDTFILSGPEDWDSLNERGE